MPGMVSGVPATPRRPRRAPDSPKRDSPKRDSPKNVWVHKPVLRGALVELRPFREEDLPAMAEALADPDVLVLTGSVHSPEEAAGRPTVLDDVGFAWYRSRADAPDRIDLAVVDLEQDSCVGEVVLNDYDAANASCNFRILIGPRGRDRGLGTEASRLIVRYGFDTLGLHRIELSVYTFNPRARRVYEKVGFRVEGVRREAFRFGDDWVDVVTMAMLAGDLGTDPGTEGAYES